MPRVLIAGCGYLGSATADLFHANGWSVEGWTSSPESAAALSQKPFAVRAVEITNAQSVATNASTVDAVVQCVSTRGGTAEDYRRIYLNGAANLAASFPGALLLFTSSTSVYAQTGGEWVTEESPAEPQRETARVLRETEELVLAHGGVVARLAGIYGPGRSALLRKFLDSSAVIDERTRYINQVHRDDAAAALHLLALKHIEHAGAAGVFNVADRQPLTQRECYEWLASNLGRPVPPMTASPRERKRGNTNKRINAEKLRASGWSLRYPDFATGMSESVLPNLAQLGA